MELVDVLVGLAILIGVIGVVVPILPGALLVLGAVVVWALVHGTGEAWAYASAAVALLVVGAVVKYVVPGRRMRDAGVPTRTIVAGGLLAIVGFFVIPVVGILVGFVLGVWLAELQRLGHPDAWPSTVAALKAVGLSILIELASVLLAAGVWLAGVAAT